MKPKTPSRRPGGRSEPVVGQVRRFGKYGPAYLIEKITGKSCQILVPENGQKATLAVSQILADPVEA